MSEGGRTFTEQELRSLRHDVRSPLMVISGFAGMLAGDGEIGDAERRDYAARIEEAAGALRAQLDEALSAPPS